MSPRRTSVEGSDTMSPASNDTKRKGDDGGPQPRAKRNRYISIAWFVHFVPPMPMAITRPRPCPCRHPTDNRQQ
jgi:hypothetical protein